MSAGRDHRVRFYITGDSHLVRDTQETRIQSAQLAVWTGMDYPVCTHGYRLVSCLAQELGHTGRKNRTLTIRRATIIKCLVVSSILRIQLTGRWSFGHSCVMDRNIIDDTAIHQGIGICGRATNTVYSLGEFRSDSQSFFIHP